MVFFLFFPLKHVFLSLYFVLSSVCFYKLGRVATSPRFEGLALYRSIPCVDYLCLVALAGHWSWSRPRPGVPRAFCTKTILVGWLELEWPQAKESQGMPHWELMEARASWGMLHQSFPANTARAGTSRGVPGCAMPGLPWWNGRRRADVNQDFSGLIMARLPWQDSSSWSKHGLLGSQGMLHRATKHDGWSWNRHEPGAPRACHVLGPSWEYC